MQSQTLTEHPANTPAAKPPREPRISKKVQKALTLLATKGMTQRDAANQAGMSETYLSMVIRKPEIQAFIARKRSENFAIGSLKASRRFLELIDAESEHVAAKVSEAYLRTTGDIKGDSTQHTVNVGVSVGYVIDLSGAGAPVHGAQPEHAPTITTTYTENGGHEP